MRHLGNWHRRRSFPTAATVCRPIGAERPDAGDGATTVASCCLAVRLAVIGLGDAGRGVVGRRRDPLATRSIFRPGTGGDPGRFAGRSDALFLAVAPAVLLIRLAFTSCRDSVDWPGGWPGRRPCWSCRTILWPWAAGRVGWLGIGMTAWLVGGGHLARCGRQPALAKCGEGGLVVARSHAADGLGTRTVTSLVATDQSASCRAPAVSCAAGGFDPSEN